MTWYTGVGWFQFLQLVRLPRVPLTFYVTVCTCVALQAHKQSYCISPLWQERCCYRIVAQHGPILPKAMPGPLCTNTCLCVLSPVCMFYDARLPCILSEYEDGREGMTKKLAYKPSCKSVLLPLLVLIAPRQGERSGLMYQQPLLTLEAGLSGAWRWRRVNVFSLYCTRAIGPPWHLSLNSPSNQDQ